jgi:low molecular weight protein-tyrosine phosphatase
MGFGPLRHGSLPFQATGEAKRSYTERCMSHQKVPMPSLLFVCVGNTCRGPMAEALAKRLRPDWKIDSAGTYVTSATPSGDAVAAMQMIGIDIQGHKATSVSSADLDEFQFVVFLCKDAKQNFLAHYPIETTKIRDLFVDDPYGNDFIEYVRCRKAISRCLSALLSDLDAQTR